MMPQDLNGILFLNKKAINLQKIAEGQRSLTQGLYQDDKGNKWYVKNTDAHSALCEVLAGEYFRFLTEGDISPEMHVLFDQDGSAYVLSRYNENLSKISPEGALPNKIIDAIIASYLIWDVDCVVSKNIMFSNKQVFRFDFGAALHNLEHVEQDLQKISFFTHLDDLKTGFSSSYLCHRTHSADFISTLERMTAIDPNSFSWQEWEEAARSFDNFNLQQIKQAIIQRTQSILQHVRQMQVNIDSTKIIPETLIAFYDLLIKEKTENNDFLLFHFTPAQLAEAHLRYYRKYNEHPCQFLDLYHRAQQTTILQASFFTPEAEASMTQMGISSDLLAFCNSTFTCKPLDNFLMANYPKIQSELHEDKTAKTSASTAKSMTLGCTQQASKRPNNDSNSAPRCIIS